ncbi:MAG TPA: hypothetical protein VKZ54_04670, partial [Membranihabitans sp.]|nr:hypothetical protein [Membranihabitans sp.]
SSSQTDQIWIEIKIWMTEDGRLHFQCKNNYLDQSNVDDLSNGIGLENVKKRLDLIYPKAHSLIISGSDDRFEVDLTMLLNKK